MGLVQKRHEFWWGGVMVSGYSDEWRYGELCYGAGVMVSGAKLCYFEWVLW